MVYKFADSASMVAINLECYANRMSDGEREFYTQVRTSLFKGKERILLFEDGKRIGGDKLVAEITRIKSSFWRNREGLVSCTTHDSRIIEEDELWSVIGADYVPENDS